MVSIKLSDGSIKKFSGSIKGDELGAFNNPLDLFIKDNFMYITEVEKV